MKNFEFLFSAYLAFWAILFGYLVFIARRLGRAQDELDKLKKQLGRPQ